jgi:predicted nucleotidyltransferase component of viral defense system
LIPNSHLIAWATEAPWSASRQIEQDLIISRTLWDLFSAPKLQGKIAFRGGTAINKLLFKRPLRYSEDIDLVQLTAEPIGPKSMQSATFCHGWGSSKESRQVIPRI